jgi:hypothetical protein
MNTASTAPPTRAIHPDEQPRVYIQAVEGPVWAAWREGTLTRATELEALAKWVRCRNPREHDEILEEAIHCHLSAARGAAMVKPLDPRRRLGRFRNGSLMERASSNLDAAEAHILNIAPADYVLGQLPCLLRHVQCHLPATDPGRQNFERIARSVGVNNPDRPANRNHAATRLAATRNNCSPAWLINRARLSSTVCACRTHPGPSHPPPNCPGSGLGAAAHGRGVLGWARVRRRVQHREGL